MEATLITTGVAGALRHVKFKTLNGIFKDARAWLASVNRARGLTGDNRYKCEIWMGDCSTRPYYDPNLKPNYVIDEEGGIE